jgi:hypothetical protein
MPNDHGEFDKACTESETTSTVGNFAHGSRETPASFKIPILLYFSGHRKGRLKFLYLPAGPR